MASAEPIEGRCAARTSTGFCEKWPMAQQARCGTHGGRAPQSVAAAERRQVEAEGRAVVAKYGFPQSMVWHEAITLGIDESYGNLLAARQLVQSLAPDQLAWSKTEVVEIEGSQFPGVNTTYGAGLHPWVVLYGQERDRLHRMSVDAGKLGLEVRRQEFAEKDANVVIEVLKGTLHDLEVKLLSGELTSVDPSQPEVLRVISSRLRALDGGM